MDEVWATPADVECLVKLFRAKKAEWSALHTDDGELGRVQDVVNASSGGESKLEVHLADGGLFTYTGMGLAKLKPNGRYFRIEYDPAVVDMVVWQVEIWSGGSTDDQGQVSGKPRLTLVLEQEANTAEDPSG